MRISGAYRRLLPLALCATLVACTPPPPAVRVVSVERPAPVPTTATAAATTPAASAPQPPLTSPGASLAERIDAYIAQPRFRHASWGIDVVDLNSGDVRYSHRAEELFVPASNAKLYTAALALATFGGDARFATTLYTTAGTRANGILAGDLILYGHGDPSLGDAAVTPNTVDWADRFAQALADLGITRVDGDLVGDDTYFHGPGYGDGWEMGDLQTWYAPRVSALSNNGNMLAVVVSRMGAACCKVGVEPAASAARVVNLTANDPAATDDTLGIARAPGDDTLYISGSLAPGDAQRRFVLSAPDPALLAAYALRDALSRHGIRVGGRVRAVHWPQASAVTPHARALAEIASPPLRELVRQMLKHSDNLYAQALLLDVGVHAAAAGNCVDRLQAPATTGQWGLCAMRAMLQRIGIGDETAHFTEGSGLSRQDLVAPSATTSLLVWVHRQPFAADLLAALPVAGVDGTLKHRMQDTAADGNVQAKTGTLTHAYALSGYLTDAGGRHLVFALYLDRYQRPRDAYGRVLPPSPRDELDAVAAMIAGSGSPGAPAH
jgi:D-alanyl-D-alanine carboxypeptidase/D-alanyl-D-alanine-endopeptidase (penicillin-binding protein 4)